jgi:predicted nucleotidyltransferase
MPIASKEERVLELFLNEPAKQWHFSQIVKTAKVSEPVASKWLNSLIKEKIILKVKPEGRMPYFIGNFREDSYRNKKRLYALHKLNESGLLARLQGLKNAKAVILFGSFSRSDWNTQSDVDVFVLGDPENLKFGTLWKGLGFQGKSREIQVHSFKTLLETRKIKSGLMKNVINGYFVKGKISDIAEVKV